MSVFKIPEWNKNPSADKIWKDIFGGEKQLKSLIKGNSQQIKKPKKSKPPKNRNKKVKKTANHLSLITKLRTSTKKALKVTKTNLVQVPDKNASNLKKIRLKKTVKKNKKTDKVDDKKVVSKSDTKKDKKDIKLKETHNVIANKKIEIAKPVSRKKLAHMTIREKMLEKLKAARFRYLNEQLYSCDGKSALNYFKKDPQSYQVYHEGYQHQVAKWPINPVDVIIQNISRMDEKVIVADFGCGEAKLAKSVKQKVYSFDLVALDDCVQVCDMSKVPLDDASVDVAVFCLSLMGTNLKDYILEANRILKAGGNLKIAEIESRFTSVDDFAKTMVNFGFQLSRKDLTNDLFYFMDFKKTKNVNSNLRFPQITLKPCLYKKR